MRAKDVRDLLEWLFYSWLPLVLFGALLTAVSVDGCVHRARARAADAARAGEAHRPSAD